MKTAIKTLVLIVLAAFIIYLVAFYPADAKTEEYWDTTEVYVTARLLNGRATPSKKGKVEARFDHGDKLTAFDWSEDHKWIEVVGGETGTVWVWYEYVTERTDEFVVRNEYSTKVKIRKRPFGRVIEYLKVGDELVIDQVILGWGHSNHGWIDLYYLTEAI